MSWIELTMDTKRVLVNLDNVTTIMGSGERGHSWINMTDDEYIEVQQSYDTIKKWICDSAVLAKKD